MSFPVVAVTAPSLDASKNVSGISSVVRLIMTVSGYEFVHYQVGSRDNEKKGLGWAAGQVSTFLRLPLFLLRNKVDALHLNTALNPLSIYRDLLLAAIARVAGVRVLIHLHGGRFLAEPCSSAITLKALKALIGLGHQVAVLSEAEIDLLRSLAYTDRRDIGVLTNCVNTAEIPASPPRANADKISLIFLGRFHESKGVDDIRAAVHLLKKRNVAFSLTAYGSGPEQAAFCADMEQSLGEDFMFGGVVSGDAKWHALAAHDVFLLPSRHGEGLPMAMLEAMAVGACVVVTDIASITSVVQNGVNGMVVEKGSAAGLAAAIERLVLDRDSVRSIGEKANETVHKHYSLGRYGSALRGLYERLLAA